jgi:hypothetical protein
MSSGRKGERRRFTDNQVIEMRRMWRAGASWAEVGAPFGIDDKKAQKIGTGIGYADVPEAITPAERRARYGRRK